MKSLLKKGSADTLIQNAQHHIKIILLNLPESSGYLELRTFSDKKQGNGANQYFLPVSATDDEILEAIEWAKTESHKGRGIFIGLNPRYEMRGDKNAVIEYAAVYLDLDLEKHGISRETAFGEIEDISPIPPTLMTDSGRGLHLAWFFEPTTDYEKWKALQEALYNKFRHLGADRSIVSDSARVLRLTPFPNQKGNEPLETKIVSFTERERQPIFAVMSELFDVNFDGATYEKFNLPREIHEGGTVEYEGRNTLLFKEASRLRGNGYNEDEIFETISVLNQTRCMPPLSSREVEKIAQSASKYTPDKDLSDNIDVAISQGVFHTAGEFLDMNLPNIEPIVYGLRAGELGMIQAVPDAGKSTLMLNLSLSLAAGRSFYPLTEGGKPKRVLFVDLENSKSFFQKDLKTMAKNFNSHERELINNNLMISVDIEIEDEPLNLSNEDHLHLVTAEAIKHDADLVIIDTYAEAFSLSNENDNAEVKRVVVSPLKKLARAANTAVMIVHHKGKSYENGSNSKIYGARGATVIAGAARMILDLDHVRDGQYNIVKNRVKLHSAKMKGKKFDDITLKLEADRRWFEAVINDDLQPEKSRLEKIASLVDKPMTNREIEDAIESIELDIAERTLSRDLSKAVRSGLLKRCKPGVYVPVDWSDNAPCDIDTDYMIESHAEN